MKYRNTLLTLPIVTTSPSWDHKDVIWTTVG